MARRVSRHEAPGFLAQAMEFLAAAKDSLERNRFNAAAFNAIQAMINANDALTIHYTEERASTEHAEALRLHLAVVRITGDSSYRSVLKNALDFRPTAGYLGEGVTAGRARSLVLDTVRFCEWVKSKIEQ